MRTEKPILWLLLSVLAFVGFGCGDNRAPENLRIDPATFTVEIGGTTAVTALFGDRAAADSEVTWTSSDTSVARVTPGDGGTATVRGIAPGTATITATTEGVSATATVTVTAAHLTSIAITPPAPSLAAGTTVQLTATGMFSDGTTTDLTATATWSSGTATVATVSASGELRGVAVGTSIITATSGSVSGTVTATVTAANLIAIDVTPPDPSIARGTSVQLMATGRFSDLSTQDLTTQVAWVSATPANASVTSAGLVTGVAVGSSVVSATMGAITGNVTVQVTAATLTSIDVTPPNPSIADGLTQQFVATGHFSDTTTQPLTTGVTWSSGTVATATINATGLATAVNPGTTVITATVGAISGSTNLTVTAATLVSIAVTPPNPSIARGRTQQFTATGTFSDATTQPLTATVTWTSGTPATATISNAAGTQGLATSANVGTTVITATSGAISGSTTLTVTAAVLVSIAVTPPNPSIARGLTQQFTATGTFSDATTQPLTSTVTWTSGTPATATISNAAGTQGLATSVNAGTTLITATSGAISGSTTLTVTAAVLVSIAVTPPNPSIARGLTQQFTATGTFSDATTQPLTATVTWTSGTPATATISNAAGTQGLATSAAVGTTLITATSGAISGSTTLTVTAATLVSIAVTPPNPSIARGLTQQFIATGTFTDATTQPLTATVTWSSGTPATATISNAAGTQGLATSAAVGTTLITATSGAISGSTTLTVTAATLVSIQVTPVNPSIAKGRTQQFTATGTFTDATTQPLTATATWTSGTPATATISNAAGTQGLATGAGVGTSLITATSGAISGSTTLTVTAAVLESIQITPVNPTIASGGTQPFVATGTFSDTTTQPLTTTVTWASSNPAVATISNAAGTQGLATAVGLGTTSITATSGLISGATTLTVTDATLVSIAVTPTNPSLVVGLNLPFTAIGTYSDASTAPLTTSVTWTSTDPTVASISNAAGSEGVATGIAAGTVTITATSGLISGSTTLTVNAVTLQSITVTPVDVSIANGRTQQYAAVGHYSDASTAPLTTAVTWGSSLTTVAQISNAAGSEGLATGVGLGVTTITATSGAIVGSTSLTVNAAVLESITITPADVTIANGLTQPYTATGHFSDGTTPNLTTTVTWASTVTTVAQISNAAGSEGLATSTGVGATVISATSGSIVGSTGLTVGPAAIVSIAVTPTTPTINVGATVQLTATATLTDTTTSNVTATVTWSSLAGTIASVNTAGLVTGVGAGTAEIRATSGAIFGAAMVTVNAVPPIVTATNPANAATNVSALTSIAITFDRAMLPASLTTQTLNGACTGSIQVSRDDFASCIGLGAVTLNGPATIATTTPAPALAFGTSYKIRVTTAVQSAVGVAMAAQFTQAAGFTTAVDAPCGIGLVISQVYGAGGNVGPPLATFNADYVELHNPTLNAISTTGMALQYASATGTGAWTVGSLTTASIPAGGYYLVRVSTVGANGAAITADFAPTTLLNMAAAAGKVALTSNATALNGACPTSAAIVDLVGFGTANCSETAPTPPISTVLAAIRNNNGCADGGNNSLDFTAALPAPRNSAVANNLICACTLNERDVTGEADYCALQHPPTTSVAVGALSENIYGRIFEGGVTPAGGADPNVRAQIGIGPRTANPQNQPGWVWANAAFNVQVGNDDEYQFAATLPAAGVFSYTSRFSLDGLHWTYCDLDGAGSNPGLSFDPARLGVVTVTTP